MRFAKRAMAMCLGVLGLEALFAGTLASGAAAESAPVCPGDVDGNFQVTTDELVTAVNRSLGGCGLLPVNLVFRAQVGERPFACGTTYDGIGTASSRWAPADLRFYIHGLRLVRPDRDRTEVPVQLEQNDWQHDDTALLDFEDHTSPCNNGTPETHTRVTGFAPQGDYTGVHFILGVPFDKNHQDADGAPSPLNLTALFWSWRGGYKFLRIDSFAVLEDDFAEFRVHLGSTGCRYGRPLEVAGCVWPNRADVLLTNFDLSRNVVVADLATLLADSDLTSNVPLTPPGCMSDREDTDCVSVFRNLGIDFDDGYPDPTAQKFFRVEPASPPAP